MCRLVSFAIFSPNMLLMGLPIAAFIQGLVMIEKLEVIVCLIHLNLCGYTSFWVLFCGYTFIENSYACQWSAYQTWSCIFMTHLNVPALFLKCTEKDSVSWPIVNNTCYTRQYDGPDVLLGHQRLRPPFSSCGHTMMKASLIFFRIIHGNDVPLFRVKRCGV